MLFTRSALWGKMSIPRCWIRRSGWEKAGDSAYVSSLVTKHTVPQLITPITMITLVQVLGLIDQLSAYSGVEVDNSHVARSASPADSRAGVTADVG